jgi:DNA-binding winged helix-turn-helix (wHTH) protein
LKHTPVPVTCAPPDGDPLMDGGRFLLGDWLVDVTAHRIARGADVVALEPRPMAVLAELCRRSRDVVTAEVLLDACWPGQAQGDNQVHKVIAGLRRALQDDASNARYIETIRKQGYRVIAPIRVLSDQGPRSLAGAWRGKSPFRGLEPFDTEHAGVYFGRDGAVKQLHQRLGEQQARGHALVVLLGPSGSGKTSLVRAGLVPAMLAGPQNNDIRLRACAVAVLDLGALDGTGPWHALAGALLDWEIADVPLLSGHSIASLSDLLRGQPDELLRLVRIGLQARPAGAAGLPLLVLDRLEGLFEPAAGADLQGFLDCIELLVRSSLAVVLAVCRNDFYPSLACHRLLMHDKEHGAHMDLAPPDAQAIMQMIRLPARAANLTYGSDASSLNRLDDRLCADAMQAGDALPLLQYTLQALYLKRAPGDELTWAAYDELGGLEGAIGSRAEAILAALPAAQQAALARLLPRLVTLSAEDASPTSRSVTGASLTDDNERALVDALIDARLLVADRMKGGAIGFRVAHEALLRRWPRVTAWVAQHRVTLTARAELGPWVRRWVESGRANALLLPRGTLLWQSGSAVLAVPHLFGREEHDFVARSQARLKAQTRWRVAATGGALALAVLAGVAAARNAQLAQTVSARELQNRRLTTFMLGELADQLRPLGRLDLLSSIGDQGLKVLSPTDLHDELPADTLQRAKALVVIGEVNSSRGKNQLALAGTALQRAYAMLLAMGPVAGVDTGEYYKTLGASAFWLGQIAYDAGQLDEASKQMARYREASARWLAAAPGHPQARAELGYALGSLSSIAMRRGRWDEAQRGFADSLALKLAVLADHPGDVEAQDAIANARTWLGQVAHLKGESAQALPLYDAARKVQLQLARDRPAESVRLRDLCVVESRRAEALQALGRRAEALAARRAAVAWMHQALVNGASNAFWQAESLLADSALLVAQADAGEDIGQEMAALKRRLASQDKRPAPNVREWQQSMVQVHLAEAWQAARAHDWPAARAHASALTQEIRDLMAQHPFLWQAPELQARAGLLLLRADAGAAGPYSAPLCARTRLALQPAIDSGQAGVVREAWLAARACAGEGATTGADLHLLTAGGYRPQSTDFPTQFNQGFDHDANRIRISDRRSVR